MKWQCFFSSQDSMYDYLTMRKTCWKWNVIRKQRNESLLREAYLSFKKKTRITAPPLFEINLTFIGTKWKKNNIEKCFCECHILSLIVLGFWLHCPHYLQPLSLVVGDEEQSYYSTSMTLHPPLCLLCFLRSPALKCEKRIEVRQLPHPNAHTKSGEHGSQVHSLKIKHQEVWWHNERSPSSYTSSDVCLRVGICVCVRVWWKQVCVQVCAHTCLQTHTSCSFLLTFAYPLSWCDAENCCCPNQELSPRLAGCS